MRYINNFIKLRELTAEDEYRKAKELPPKEDLSPYDILEKYKDDPMVMISFRDEYYTKTKRLGMNLSSSYNTPNGIYCYPLSIIWEENFDHKNRKIDNIPFTGRERPMSIVVMRLKGKGLNLINYTAQNYSNDIKILNNKFSIDSDFIENNTEKYFNKLGNYNNYYSYSYYIWGVTRAIFRKIKGYSDYSLDDEYDDEDSLDESILNEGEIPTNYWNFIFSKILGYKWVSDEGLGIIHQDEPIQCVIFENSAYDLIDSIDISKIDYKKSRKDLSLENKLLDFLKKLIKDGNVKRIKILLNSYPKILNTKDYSGYTLLSVACEYGELEIVKLLLEQPNIDVNTKNDKGWTPLHIAYRIDILKLLLEHPDIDVNNIRDKNENPLSRACKQNHIELVKLLLARPEIDVNIQDYYSKTPLYIVCENNNIEIVKLLLAKPEIDVNVKNKDGKTSLLIVCIHHKIEIVKLLLAKPDIDVNVKDNNGWTPLFIACRYNKIEIVKLLLAKPDIDVNVKSEYGDTLLAIAKRNKNQELIDLLEEHGAKE